MYRFASIDDVLKHQLANKKARSEIRYEDIQNSEKPREVYLKTCLTIANYFKDYGFEYSKSSASLVHEVKDKQIRFRIRFQSDYNNIAGIYVGLSVSFFIEDIGLKKWQKKNGIPSQNPWEQIFGAGLSYFSKMERLLIQWNIADNIEREIAIIEIVDTIENDLLSFFYAFLNVDLISDLIIKGNSLLTSPLINIQYLLFHKSKVDAKTAITNYLDGDKNAMEAFVKDKEIFENNKKSAPETGLYYNIPYLMYYYDLN